jgi:hypothetical protein
MSTIEVTFHYESPYVSVKVLNATFRRLDCLRLQVEPERDSLSLDYVSPEDGDRIQFSKRRILSKRQENG